jgi:hypothetical protein
VCPETGAANALRFEARARLAAAETCTADWRSSPQTDQNQPNCLFDRERAVASQLLAIA